VGAIVYTLFASPLHMCRASGLVDLCGENKLRNNSAKEAGGRIIEGGPDNDTFY